MYDLMEFMEYNALLFTNRCSSHLKKNNWKM